MAFKLGKAKLTTFAKKNYFKLKDGDNVYRILPPMFDCADNGVWNRYYAVEYGYKNSKGKICPFQDVRVVDRKTKMVEVESPAFLLRQKMQENVKKAQEMMDAGKISKDAFEKVKEQAGQFNLDAKFYVNAIDLQGNIGLLKIPTKAMEQIKNIVKTKDEAGYDCLGVETGMFFKINRSGMGRSTTYVVTEYKQKKMVTIEGAQTEVEVAYNHALDEVLISRLEKECFNLDTLFKKLTVDQVQEIVDGGPLAVDKYFGSQEEEKTPVDDEELPPAQDIGFTKPVAQKVEETIPEPVKAEPAKVEPPKAEKPIPAPKQDDEDFLKSLGL
jgi:hypothetical protein